MHIIFITLIVGAIFILVGYLNKQGVFNADLPKEKKESEVDKLSYQKIFKIFLEEEDNWGKYERDYTNGNDAPLRVWWEDNSPRNWIAGAFSWPRGSIWAKVNNDWLEYCDKIEDAQEENIKKAGQATD